MNTPSLRTLIATLGACVVVAPAGAQSGARNATDSALVGRILLAEDRRDSMSAAFDEGKRSRDARIRVIARRAEARVRDPKFAIRDSLPGATLPPPPAYPDPAWRLRYRALTAKSDCATLRDALADSVWHVRLRAADLVGPACAGDSVIVGTLHDWARFPAPTRRRPGAASWQPAAHAIVALARLTPTEARMVLPLAVTSPSPWVRKYAARAASILRDTTNLRHLAADPDANVMEAGIEGLSSLVGHAGDDAYLAALGSKGYQAVRAGARALKGSPRSGDIVMPALAASRRFRADSSETSRDARMAVMELLDEFATSAPVPELITWLKDDAANDWDCVVASFATAILQKLHATSQSRCMPTPSFLSIANTPLGIELPTDAVSLALGRVVRIRVTLADSSGGGSFVVRLRGDVAPIMAARVLALARSGYYNGLVWQRVEPDFVVQGGGLGANEYVGNPRFMRDELGTVPHVPGTVGMSTRGHDTGDGQWFFNLRDNRRLDRDYTVFGEVVEGMGVVDGILEGDVIARMDVLPSPS